MASCCILNNNGKVRFIIKDFFESADGKLRLLATLETNGDH